VNSIPAAGLLFVVVVVVVSVVAVLGLSGVVVVPGVQKPQASAHRCLTNLLSCGLIAASRDWEKSMEQAPVRTSVLHMLSSATFLQPVPRCSPVVEFTTHRSYSNLCTKFVSIIILFASVSC